MQQYSASGTQTGTETKLSGQGQRLSQTNLWHGLNYESLSDALPIPGNGVISLDPDPSSGLGEDKAGLLPQWDRAEPPGRE